MNSKSRKCRTCLDGTKGLQCLTNPAVGVDDDDQNKSYADLLMEVVHINTLEDSGDIWPYFICNCCSRKLKAAYVYIQQALHINEILKSSLIEYNGIHGIVTEYMEVKMEAVENYHKEEGEEELEVKEEHILTANNINCEKDNILQDSKSSLFPNEERNELCGTFADIKETKHESQVSGTRNEKKLKTLPKTKCKKSTKLLKTKDTEEQKQNDTIDTPVKCNDCDKIFENSRQLNRHLRSAHVPEELQVQCLQCEAKFARRHNMLAHLRLFHKIDNIEELELATTNTTFCDNPMATNTSPKKRFLCTLCGLTFNSQYCLNIHFRRHTGEKPYKCEFCDRAYIRLCDVQVHRRSHTGEKPYKCHLCEKAFSRANKLKIHIRSHTNERPYKCTQCEKAFKQSKHLNEHMRTHTGERPYRCGVCQSTFTQSNSLRSHQITQKHLEATNTTDDLPDQSNEDLNISDRNLLV
ncbi:zinc finger protein 501-like [Calliphora vicina]|uniref:zinc finger protein 501-like n=1 Tax=Calliphora vicina TaxID=7373 RepID=UPI00325A8D88